jgi:uncharacterized protein (DUF2141 family)
MLSLISAQVRDTSPPASLGSASIAGTVVTDEANSRPVRRALVSLNGGTGRGGGANTLVTDDAGRFRFTALQAGRYTLTATRPGYVNGTYGATRPGRTGTPIELGTGQQLTDAKIKLARGAVITGTIFDQNNDPLPAARISLMRYVYSAQSGERTLQPRGGSASTDDRGTYRIYGIAPGEYLVRLESPFSLPGDLRQTTDQSMQAALQQFRSTPGGAAPAAAVQKPVQGPTVAYAPTFYPGSPSPASATTVKLATGEERAGVDMQLQLVPTARIEGIVVGPNGLPAPDAQLSVLGADQSDMAMSMLRTMFGMTRPGPDGSFSLAGIAPGQYTLAARTGDAGRRGGPPTPGPVLWATAEVTVDGQDVSGVRLALEPGMTLSGRVAFEGSGATPPDAAAVSVALAPVLSGSSVAMVPQRVQADGQGNFTVLNITPGRYRVSATLAAGGPGRAGQEAPSAPAGGAGASWALKSATTKGREVLDAGLVVRPNENISDVLLTFTNRVTTLSGTLQDATGRAAPDYFIILYASDQSHWTPFSRRVIQTRPATDGRFSFRNIPPGEYLLAAVTDVEPGEWMDPGFLRQLAPFSIKVSLTEGEAKTQDIKLAGGV